MAFAEDTEGREKQAYKYNGKELDTRLKLNIYDYAARYMDSAIGRFTSVDPHAENYYSWSPYAYVMNNPMKYIDPLGTDTVPTNEIWDYHLVNFRTNGGGVHSDNYTPIKVDGRIKYHLHKMTSGLMAKKGQNVR